MLYSGIDGDGWTGIYERAESIEPEAALFLSGII